MKKHRKPNMYGGGEHSVDQSLYAFVQAFIEEKGNDQFWFIRRYQVANRKWSSDDTAFSKKNSIRL
jgi:hypothetical protein